MTNTVCFKGVETTNKLKVYLEDKKTYPTLGKEKSSSNMPYQEDMLIPWRVWVSLERQMLFSLGSRHHDGELCCHTLGESHQICTTVVLMFEE